MCNDPDRLAEVPSVTFRKSSKPSASSVRHTSTISVGSSSGEDVLDAGHADADREPGPDRRTDGGDDLAQEPHPIVEVAAVLRRCAG